MANNLTPAKRRQPGRKADDIRLVWKKQAPDTLFAGKSLADLEAALAARQESGETVSELALAFAKRPRKGIFENFFAVSASMSPTS